MELASARQRSITSRTSLTPALSGREGVEGGVGGVGDNAGQGRLSDSGRSPENERGNALLFDHAAQYGAGAHEVGLAYVVVKGGGTHPLG